MVNSIAIRAIDLCIMGVFLHLKSCLVLGHVCVGDWSSHRPSLSLSLVPFHRSLILSATMGISGQQLRAFSYGILALAFVQASLDFFSPVGTEAEEGRDEEERRRAKRD